VKDGSFLKALDDLTEKAFGFDADH